MTFKFLRENKKLEVKYRIIKLERKIVAEKLLLNQLEGLSECKFLETKDQIS